MNNLKKVRKIKGLKQQDVAKHLNISQAALSKWETGDHEPDIRGLTILSNLYNVSIDYLLGNIIEGEPSQSNYDDPLMNEKFKISEKILELDIDQARAIDSIIKQMKK